MNLRGLEDIVGREHLGEHEALSGVPVARPKNLEEARELLLFAGSESLYLVLFGLGSKLGWPVLATSPDFALSTSRLSGVTEFEPGDGTISALAGTAISELRRVTREAGLALTPDVPRPEQATLGGTIAANASGADRLALGPGRLHVLGTRVLQMNGEHTRSGGNLVKNVSGYDLQRLYSGSFGSLALILEASLRLAPDPESSLVLTRRFDDLESALQVAGDALGARVSPRAVTIENQLHAGAWGLHVVLFGRRGHLEHQLTQLSRVLGEFELEREAAARDLAQTLRDLEPDSRERPVIHVGVQPSALGAAIGELFDSVGTHTGAKAVVQPGVATIDLSLEADALKQPQAILRNLRSALRPLGANATLRTAGPLGHDSIAEVVDPLRTNLMQRLRNGYDPRGLLCTRPPLGGMQ